MTTRPGALGGLLRDRAFLAAMATAVVVALGFGLVVPVLPLFARSFGVGLFAVTGLVSAFAGVRLVSNPVTGALTDRIGARDAIAAGAAIVAVSSVAAAAAPSYWWLLVLRGVGGFGSALFFNALLTLVITIVPSDARGRAVGALQGAFLAGIAFGPTIGGALAEPLGLRWPFAIYGVFCGLAAVVARLGLPDPDRGDGTADRAPPAGSLRFPEIVRAARELSTDRAFVAALVAIAASRWAATGVRFSLVPVFGVEVVGGTQAFVGVALTAAAVAQLAALWPAGRLADTVGRRAVGAPAYAAFAGVSAVLAWATTPTLFVVALVGYGLGTGFTSVAPPAIVADVVPKERTGTGVGVLNTAGDLGTVLGPLVSGWLADAHGFAWGFGASAALLVVAALALAATRETLPPPER